MAGTLASTAELIQVFDDGNSKAFDIGEDRQDLAVLTFYLGAGILRFLDQPQWQRLFNTPLKLFVVLCICAVASHPFAGFEDHRFDNSRLKLADQIGKILVDYKVCSNNIECQKLQHFFASPLGGGIAIQVWGVANVAAIQAIEAACFGEFMRNPDMLKLSIDVYEIKKGDALRLPIWNIAQVKISVTYSRNENAKR